MTYIRRKVFSLLQDENGEERYFSTTEFEIENDIEQREFAKVDFSSAMKSAKKKLSNLGKQVSKKADSIKKSSVKAAKSAVESAEKAGKKALKAVAKSSKNLSKDANKLADGRMSVKKFVGKHKVATAAAGTLAVAGTTAGIVAATKKKNHSED